MPVQISDDAGVKNLVYNSFNELEVREGCKPSYKDHPCLWLITWDPTQPVATRPLAIQKDGTWYTYGWDLTKNICEIFGQNGYIRSTYVYSPYGSVTANGDINQPIQWSSEYFDNELALVYYNYRHYNPTDGRWINRDPIAEQGGWNLYAFVGNRFYKLDYCGLSRWGKYNKPKPDPHKNIPKFTPLNYFEKIIQNKLFPIKDIILVGISVYGYIPVRLYTKYLNREGGEYVLDLSDVLKSEEGEIGNLFLTAESYARIARLYARDNKLFSRTFFLEDWVLLDSVSWAMNYVLKRYYMTMSAYVDKRCRVSYTVYVSDVYDFDPNAIEQNFLYTLAEIGLAAPFNVRGMINFLMDYK